MINPFSPTTHKLFESVPQIPYKKADVPNPVIGVQVDPSYFNTVAFSPTAQIFDGLVP